jgi:ferritin-like metal-binding protein YciE
MTRADKAARGVPRPHLQALYSHELSELHDCESQLIEVLPKFAARAGSRRLAEVLKHHVDETRRQRERLERIFADLGAQPTGACCEGMQGIVAETDQLLDVVPDEPTRDFALLRAAGRIEHYELASYSAARAHADLLGFREHVRLFELTLAEEAAAGRRLVAVGQSLDPPVSADGPAYAAPLPNLPGNESSGAPRVPA